MSKVFIRQSMLTLTADFNPGSPQWSYDRGDDGNSPRRIDFDDAANLLRRMLMPTDNHHPLPDYITLKGAHAVNVDYSQNWGRMCCASVDVASAEAMEIYGVGWTAVMSANMQSVVSKFVAMCSTPGGLEWWERRFRLENAIRNLNVYAQMDMPRAAYRAEYEHIQSDPEFKNIEAPDFIGDTLLATKFAELDIAITGKKPQGYKRYPFRFEDIVGSQDLIYLNDGGYSRMGLFINTDDTIRIVICMNEKSDHHGRQHDDDVTAKMREIQEAATTWYRAARKEAGVDASCH